MIQVCKPWRGQRACRPNAKVTQKGVQELEGSRDVEGSYIIRECSDSLLSCKNPLPNFGLKPHHFIVIFHGSGFQSEHSREISSLLHNV